MSKQEDVRNHQTDLQIPRCLRRGRSPSSTVRRTTGSRHGRKLSRNRRVQASWRGFDHPTSVAKTTTIAADMNAKTVRPLRSVLVKSLSLSLKKNRPAPVSVERPTFHLNVSERFIFPHTRHQTTAGWAVRARRQLTSPWPSASPGTLERG